MPNACSDIPNPPYMGPFPTSANKVYPSQVTPYLTGVIYAYQVERGGWFFFGFFSGTPEQYPLGYYRTPCDETALPFIAIVTQRFDGTQILPNVLNPADAPLVQNTDCADGLGTVDLAELKLGDPAGDQIAGLISDYGIQSMCAVLATIKVPTCPAGQVWDPATETCKPIVIPPPPPVCPPGYHYDITAEKCVANDTTTPPPPTCPPGFTWDPIAEICQANPQPQPPPPCPPFTELPQCLPTPPPTNPDNDEIGDAAGQIAYWLQILTIYVLNLFQFISTQGPGGGTGGTQPSDPVTCTQLTALVAQLTEALQAIAAAIAAGAPGGSGAPDLTEVVQKLGAIADAIAAQGPEEPIDLKPIVDAINAAPDGEAKAKAVIQYLQDQEGFDAGLGQILTS